MMKATTSSIVRTRSEKITRIIIIIDTFIMLLLTKPLLIMDESVMIYTSNSKTFWEEPAPSSVKYNEKAWSFIT